MFAADQTSTVTLAPSTWLGAVLLLAGYIAGSRVLAAWIERRSVRSLSRSEFDQTRAIAALDALQAYGAAVQQWATRAVPRNTSDRDQQLAELSHAVQAHVSSTGDEDAARLADAYIGVAQRYATHDEDTNRNVERDAFSACLARLRGMMRDAR